MHLSEELSLYLPNSHLFIVCLFFLVWALAVFFCGFNQFFSLFFNFFRRFKCDFAFHSSFRYSLSVPKHVLMCLNACCCDVLIIESPLFCRQTKEVTCGWIFLVSTVNFFTSLLLMFRNKQRSCQCSNRSFVITLHLRREGQMSLLYFGAVPFWKFISTDLVSLKWDLHRYKI